MYPIELSGGMKQRMVMVLSTLLNPSLLIADEITSALDVSSQKAVAEMLVRFRDRDFVQERDRHHPRYLGAVPDGRHHAGDVRRAAG
jgi:ABC-type polar amino acid transport system ATPase subunit